MSTLNTFTCPTDRLRLDVFLAGALGVSRSVAQRSIKVHGAQVNGTLSHIPHTFLSQGDTITTAWPTTPFASAPTPQAQVLPNVVTLFSSPSVFVFLKPAGLLVHGNGAMQEPTLADHAIALDPAIATVGEHAQRPGIVHRLDRLVSGAIVVARTQEAFLHLKDQFQNHTVEKRYDALVHGRVVRDMGDIHLRLARGAHGRMVARPESQEGRESHTQFTVHTRYANATRLDINLLTGRTHQIRAHLHALGHPVVGDPLYAPHTRSSLRLPRLWLHAHTLAFTDPATEERITVEAPLPNELVDFLTTLHPLV
jgi:23S rRNA pseudouridine1911/1915/1917 synthase